MPLKIDFQGQKQTEKNRHRRFIGFYLRKSKPQTLSHFSPYLEQPLLYFRGYIPARSAPYSGFLCRFLPLQLLLSRPNLSSCSSYLTQFLAAENLLFRIDLAQYMSLKVANEWNEGI
jgi:hypothetical protein